MVVFQNSLYAPLEIMKLATVGHSCSTQFVSTNQLRAQGVHSRISSRKTTFACCSLVPRIKIKDKRHVTLACRVIYSELDFRDVQFTIRRRDEKRRPRSKRTRVVVKITKRGEDAYRRRWRGSESAIVLKQSAHKLIRPFDQAIPMEDRARLERLERGWRGERESLTIGTDGVARLARDNVRFYRTRSEIILPSFPPFSRFFPLFVSFPATIPRARGVVTHDRSPVALGSHTRGLRGNSCARTHFTRAKHR